ncbi:MAG: BspA family leucine-rich repeat surface protein [Bacteroidetes bacterium]|nr:BspA family leucine-rich repeat surface protein [Bacteroidota bacterium]
MENAFLGCNNLVINATDTPNLSGVINMVGMFGGASSLGGGTGNWNWDVSNVSFMIFMFESATSFDQDIGSWDVSNVSGMTGMFLGATSFNQNIGSWDVSNVLVMRDMFRDASSFDQDIGSWDVSNVNNMFSMFLGATLSTTNYDSLLIGWNALTLQPNINFHGGNSTYCSGAAQAARANMIASDGWTITDGGAEFIIADPITLFPPDFIYETIELSQLFVSVSCLAISIDDVYIASVSSDEEEDLPGPGGGFDGNTVDDIVIAPGCQSVQLRRERNFRLNGRVYTINLAVDDGNGNTAVASVKVHVPRNPNGTAIDDGVAYFEECDKSTRSPSLAVEDHDSYSIDVKFWPNPSDGYFNIKLITNNYSDNVEIQVYDVNSRLLHYNEFAPEDEYQFGRELAAGVYIVKIMQAGKIRSARVVKY